MSNNSPTYQERKNIDKFGFYAKGVVSFIDVIKNIPSQILLLGIFSGIGFLLGEISCILTQKPEFIIYTMIFCILPIIGIIGGSLMRYIFLGKIFFKKGGYIFAYGSSLKGIESGYSSIIRKIDNSFYWLNNIIESTKLDDVYSSLILIIITLFSIILDKQIAIVLGVNLTYGFIIPLIIFLGALYILSFLLHHLIESFHPLYAFGNFGEKIQKLTPTIESQSQLIQSQFEKDQNFGILHSGFEKLSTTFSEIVSIVVKLEDIEKKANKGNLFDSEKYINSLRLDIVLPLEQLKKFLEKQKDELKKSQQELTRVRVGWDESPGNRELQSKRSDVLLQELEKNIESLQGMIGKMR